MLGASPLVGKEVDRVNGRGESHVLVLGEAAGGIEILFGKIEGFFVDFADGGEDLGPKKVALGVLGIELDAVTNLFKASVQAGQDGPFILVVLILVPGEIIGFGKIVLGQVQTGGKGEGGGWRAGGGGDLSSRKGGKKATGGFFPGKEKNEKEKAGGEGKGSPEKKRPSGRCVDSGRG